MTRCAVDVALVHYPIRSRTGEIVTTSVTNLDIHDIARAGRTYGVRAYHVVTPLEIQRRLVEGVAAHWVDGPLRLRGPERAEALSLVRTAASLADVVRSIRDEEGVEPLVVATSGRPRGRPTVGFEDLRARILSGPTPVALCFGTGWGLADDAFDRADLLLDPVMKGGGYNYLSVRVAVGIILDRLLGDR